MSSATGEKAVLSGIGAQLTIIIPAFNEEEGIRLSLENLKSIIPDAEIIVVDDGSNDETNRIALSVPGIRVVNHLFNRGYGAALKTGMILATRPLIAWFDADNEHRAEDLLAMAELITQNRLAAVVGERSHAVSTVRYLGKTLIRRLSKVLGTPLENDINCGLRVFRRDAILPYLSLLPNSFSASLTSTMIMIERNYPIKFYKISLRPRLGQSKVHLVHGWQALFLVLRFVMLFAPLRIFVPLGVGLTIMGLGYGLTIFLIQRQGWPTLSALIIIWGAISVMLGLIADQLSQLRLGQLHSRPVAQELTWVEKVNASDK